MPCSAGPSFSFPFHCAVARRNRGGSVGADTALARPAPRAVRSRTAVWGSVVGAIASLMTGGSGVVHAQSIAGRVLERESGHAVVGAFISVYDANDVPAARGEFSNRSGAFEVSLPRPGTFRVRVEALGFEPFDVETVSVPGTATVTLVVRLQQSPVQLDPLEVGAPPLSLQEELSIRGARRRHATTPAAGPSRVFMDGDPEMRSAADITDIMRWVPRRRALCTVWFVNGFRTDFPMEDMPANWFEAIEVYRDVQLVPDAFKSAETVGCEVVALWYKPGGRKLTFGRLLALAGAIGLMLLVVK